MTGFIQFISNRTMSKIWADSKLVDRHSSDGRQQSLSLMGLKLTPKMKLVASQSLNNCIRQGVVKQLEREIRQKMRGIWTLRTTNKHLNFNPSQTHPKAILRINTIWKEFYGLSNVWSIFMTRIEETTFQCGYHCLCSIFTIPDLIQAISRLRRTMS